MEARSPQGIRAPARIQGKAEQINNTTSQLTGTFHWGLSMYFTNNTYFPVSQRQGDKWQAQRSHRKCAMILRTKSRPYSLVSGLTDPSPPCLPVHLTLALSTTYGIFENI